MRFSNRIGNLYPSYSGECSRAKPSELSNVYIGSYLVKQHGILYNCAIPKNVCQECI